MLPNGHPGAPGQLALASNRTDSFTSGSVGKKKKLGVGGSPGGRMAPFGISAIDVVTGTAEAESVPIGTARTVTTLTFESNGGGDGGGAVNTTRATPSALVTMVRADRLPTSTSVSANTVSTLIATPPSAAPLGPVATTAIEDCEAPSWVKRSGVAVIVKERAIVDGPVSAGASA